MAPTYDLLLACLTPKIHPAALPDVSFHPAALRTTYTECITSFIALHRFSFTQVQRNVVCAFYFFLLSIPLSYKLRNFQRCSLPGLAGRSLLQIKT